MIFSTLRLSPLLGSTFSKFPLITKGNYSTSQTMAKLKVIRFFFLFFSEKASK